MGFNSGLPKSSCISDEQAGINYGANGASRDAFATRDCNNQGYWGRSGTDWRDCGNWAFQWNCQQARPSGWTPCYRDEEAVKAGFPNAAGQGNTWCVNNGFTGQAGTHDCGSFYTSFQCVTPSYSTGWVDEGCQGDSTHKYSAKVQANGLDWNVAADWMVKREIATKGQWGNQYVSIGKENRGAAGIYVVLYLQKNDCFVYKQAVNTGSCTDIHTRQASQQCNNWPSGWSASNDVVNACKKNAPPNSTVGIQGTQVWATRPMTDNSCDTVQFSPYKAICDPQGNSVSFSHCTNWFNNNPQTCSQSINST